MKDPKLPLLLALVAIACVDEATTTPPSGGDGEAADATAKAPSIAAAPVSETAEVPAKQEPPPEAMHVAIEGRWTSPPAT